MGEQTSMASQLFEKIEQFVLIRLEILKLKLLGKSSEVLAVFISSLVMLSCLLVFMLFLSIGIALILGEWLGKVWLGFFSVALLYGILWAYLLFFRRKWLKEKILDAIVTQILEDDEQ